MEELIHFHSEEISFELPHPILIREWLKKSIESERKVLQELSFVFCSDDYLHQLNLEYLSHDTLTDIITFDYSEGQSIAGDIFISVDRVKENSQELNTEFQTELNRVMIHGVLHLCGYKDKSAEEQATMRAKEDFYLNLQAENG